MLFSLIECKSPFKTKRTVILSIQRKLVSCTFFYVNRLKFVKHPTRTDAKNYFA